MLGMRLVRGVPWSQVQAAGLTEVLEDLAADGLVELVSDCGLAGPDRTGVPRSGAGFSATRCSRGSGQGSSSTARRARRSSRPRWHSLYLSANGAHPRRISRRIDAQRTSTTRACRARRGVHSQRDARGQQDARGALRAGLLARDRAQRALDPRGDRLRACSRTSRRGVCPPTPATAASSTTSSSAAVRRARTSTRGVRLGSRAPPRSTTSCARRAWRSRSSRTAWPSCSRRASRSSRVRRIDLLSLAPRRAVFVLITASGQVVNRTIELAE